MAVVTVLEIAGIDKDVHAFGDGQRKLRRDAVRGREDQKLLAGGVRQRGGLGGCAARHQGSGQQESGKDVRFADRELKISSCPPQP